MPSSDPLFDAILDGDRQEIRKQVEALSARGITADDILNHSCIPAMLSVRQRLDAGELYVPDLLVSQQAYVTALNLLQPSLSSQTYEQALALAEYDLSCFL